MNVHNIRWLKYIGLFVVMAALLFIGWQLFKKPTTVGDWQEQLKVSSVAEFSGNKVTVRNIRNFRYSPTEADMHPAYYDAEFDLERLKKVWYVSEPFNGQEYAAHTFVSFEFEDEAFLAITIEARKTKEQVYSALKGVLRTYPLIYIAADERDVVLLRANVRKDNVFVYPIKTTKENAQKLLVDMLTTMNKLQSEPEWYNTLTANCTSRIVYHVNRVVNDRVPFSWKVWLTGYADELALDVGLLDTDLTLEQARKKFGITEKSNQIGDVNNYSVLIRQFPE